MKRSELTRFLNFKILDIEEGKKKRKRRMSIENEFVETESHYTLRLLNRVAITHSTGGGMISS
jgi:hypothetical protein